jgi:hypothetical protein
MYGRADGMPSFQLTMAVRAWCAVISATYTKAAVNLFHNTLPCLMRNAPCERLYPQLTPDASSRIETNLWLLLITEPCLARDDPVPPTLNHTTKANRKHRIELYEYDFASTKPSVSLSKIQRDLFAHNSARRSNLLHASTILYAREQAHFAQPQTLTKTLQPPYKQ